MANETSITGSIGVIIQTLNYEQLFNKIGLASVVFKSGKFKDMLNGARPDHARGARAYIQSFVMETYDKFLGIVAKERNLPADTLRNGIADGRILSGRDALDNKLIDGLGQIEDAFAKAKELGRAPDAKIVKYGPPFSLGRVFRLLTKAGDTQNRALPSRAAHSAIGERARLFSARVSTLPERTRQRDVRQPDQHAARGRGASMFTSRSSARSRPAGERRGLARRKAIRPAGGGRGRAPRAAGLASMSWPRPGSSTQFISTRDLHHHRRLFPRRPLVLTSLLQFRGFNVALVRRIFPARFWADREHGGRPAFCRLSAPLRGRRHLALVPRRAARAGSRSSKCLPARKRSSSAS